MYLKRIAIKNMGPIEELFIQATFTDENNPKPIVIVGENGTGKTVLLSSIVDSFYEIASSLFGNVAKLNGLKRRYFKIQGGNCVRLGAKNAFSTVQYSSSVLNKYIEYLDYVGDIVNDIELLDFLSNLISSKQNLTNRGKIITQLSSNQKKILQGEWNKQAHFYQPAYRYEEPSWKNKDFYSNDLFEENQVVLNKYDKELEIVNSLKPNRSFLMKVVLDKYIYQENKDKQLWKQFNEIIQIIKQDTTLHFGISSRSSGTRLSITKNRKQYLKTVNLLSLGEIILLNMFVNIIRHTDKSKLPNSEVKGIVVIDEIDVHLHTKFQQGILPELIATFPKIQFIVTTHSPLFVLGMRERFGDEGFDLIEMPSGTKITAERFREFQTAFDVFVNTKKFEEKLIKKIQENNKPKIYVEGKTDVQYIQKACDIFGKKDWLKQLDIEQIGFESKKGSKHSNNNALVSATKFLMSKPQYLNNKVLFLHDPEMDKIKEDDLCDGKLLIRKMKCFKDHHIKSGIENLFSNKFIEKCCKTKKNFFKKITIEQDNETIMQLSINNKHNLCEWICENGTKEDFKNFKTIIQIIDEFLQGS